MTELSSQIYDQNILSYYTDGSSNYLKATPSWVRSIHLVGFAYAGRPIGGRV